MDHAVALVQAYLQLNGYFTSAEYPIIAAAGRNGFRTLTDIDVLAFRFPTGLPSPARRRASARRAALDMSDVDPGLGVPPDSIDMVIGEVKEGRVGINSGARDPEVLKTVISRLGDSTRRQRCASSPTCSTHGSATLAVRLHRSASIAFGSFPPGAPVPPCRIISLGHVLDFLQRYVRKHWNVLRHLQFKDPAFGFLMTLEKARRGGAGRRGEAGVEIVSSKPRPPHDRAADGGDAFLI